MIGTEPTDRALAPGSRLGDYEVVALLGDGGQGRVYEARRADAAAASGREPPAARVALKTPRGPLAERLLAEARLAGELSHPHIVRVEAVHPEGPTPFFVMELCPGGDLEQRLAAHPGGLPVSEVGRIARAVLGGLAYAHERGVVHGDLKPRNVVFDAADQPKLCDFGVGRAAAALDHTLEETRAATAGTPVYMAPEQCDRGLLGGGPLDGRADLFAFGKVVYRMLTGRGAQALRPVTHARHDLAPEWDELVFRLTEERREDRFTNAACALEALDRVLAGGSIGRASLRRRAFGRVRGVAAWLAGIHLGGAAILFAMAGFAAGELAWHGLLRTGAWTALVGLAPAFHLAEGFRARGASLGALVQAWLGLALALAALGGSVWIARLSVAAPEHGAAWASAAYAAFILLALGARLLGAGLRRAAPPPPLDAAGAELRTLVRLPAQIVVFVTVAWLIAVWLQLRPAGDARLLFGAGAGAVLAWRLAAPEARVRWRWPALGALVVLAIAIAAGLGWSALLGWVADRARPLAPGLALVGGAALAAVLLPRGAPPPTEARAPRSDGAPPAARSRLAARHAARARDDDL